MSYKLIESTPKPSFKRFVQRSLGLDLVKGLGITLKEFFTPSTIATIKYPLEKIPLSPRYRAIHKLMRLLESGEERCIGCGLCEKICISNCIKIETGYGDDGRKRIDSYTINFGRCIYCGFCAEVCPEIAIIHGERYENSAEQRAHFANKGVMLTPLDLALRGEIDEFAGYGSLREEADECVKLTPTDYVKESASNSVLGMQFRTQNAESTLDSAKSQNLGENSNKVAESTLDSANLQNLVKNNPCEAPKSRPLRGAKNREQGRSSASADFLLEAEKRGSPPKSEKAELFGAQGERGEGCSPFCEKESKLSGENSGKVAESSLDSANQIKTAESNATKDIKC